MIKYVRLLRIVLGVVLSDITVFAVYVKLFGYDQWSYPGIFIVLFLAWCLLWIVDRLTVVNLFLACVVLNIILYHILGFAEIKSNMVGLLSVALSVLVFWLTAYGARYRVQKVAVSTEPDEESDNPVLSWQAVTRGMPLALFVLSVSGVLTYLVLNHTIDWISVVAAGVPVSLLLSAVVGGIISLIFLVISILVLGEYTVLTPEPVSFIGEYEIIAERPLVALFPDMKVFVKIDDSSYHNEFLATEYEFEHKFAAYYMGGIIPLENEISVVLYGDDTELQLRMINRYYSSHDGEAILVFAVTEGIPHDEVYDRIKIINDNGVELRDVSISWGRNQPF